MTDKTRKTIYNVNLILVFFGLCAAFYETKLIFFLIVLAVSLALTLLTRKRNSVLDGDGRLILDSTDPGGIKPSLEFNDEFSVYQDRDYIVLVVKNVSRI